MNGRRRMMKFGSIAAALVALTAGSSLANAEPLRLAYWSSGFSLGFGAVLQQEDFLEKEGLDAEFRTFSEVAAPAQAVPTGAVDVAFAAPTAGAFNLSTQAAHLRVLRGAPGGERCG